MTFDAVSSPRVSEPPQQSGLDLEDTTNTAFRVDSLHTLDTPSVSSTVGATNQHVECDDQSESAESEHFVGELNPESAFLAATTPQSPYNSATDTVGVWLPRKALESLQNHLGGRAQDSDPLLANILLPYMRRQCQQLVPQSSDYAALFQIYLQEVHPVFPAIDLNVVKLSDSNSSPSILVLKQAISLAASMSPRAALYLNLPNSTAGTTSSSDQAASRFADRLASAIRTSIDLGFVRDRLVIVQVLTVLALFTQFSRVPNVSAEITARAISQAQTMGLHLDLPATRKNSEFLIRLFCCVWAVDKLNAAFQGRPTMMHEHDFERKISHTSAMQDGSFRLVLRLVGLLDEVITLYRPLRSQARANMGAIHVPAFEDLIHECNATRVSYNLLGKSHACSNVSGSFI